MKSRENFIRDRQLFESSSPTSCRQHRIDWKCDLFFIGSERSLGCFCFFFCCILGASCLAKIGILFNIFTRSLSPQTEISFNDISLSRKIICWLTFHLFSEKNTISHYRVCVIKPREKTFWERVLPEIFERWKIYDQLIFTRSCDKFNWDPIDEYIKS